MGQALQCQYSEVDPDEEEAIKNKNETAQAFSKGKIIEVKQKLKLKQKGKDAVTLHKGMRLKITNIVGKKQDKLRVESVIPGELKNPVNMGPKYHIHLRVVEGEPDHPPPSTTPDPENPNDHPNTLPRPPTAPRDDPLPESGWYEVKHAVSTNYVDNAMKTYTYGDIIRLIQMTHTEGKTVGKISGTEFLVDVIDENDTNLEKLEKDRIAVIDMKNDGDDNWGLGISMPSKKKENVWEVTHLEEGLQAANNGVQIGWLVVGVDASCTVVDEDLCEQLLLSGDTCRIFFDKEHEPDYDMDKDSEGDMEENLDGSSEKVKEAKPWTISASLCAFSGFIAFALVGVMVYFHEIFSPDAFIDRLNNKGPNNLENNLVDCKTNFPFQITVWMLTVLFFCLCSIPAHFYDGTGTLLQGAGVLCAVLFAIWPLIEFFTLSSSCERELKEDDDLWIVYQTFFFTQLGLGGCALAYSALRLMGK